jgi:hypothetical protein
MQLWVGPAGATPDCRVIDILPACSFNPTIQRVLLSGLDCNGNGIDDWLDIAGGASADGNGDSIPDECQGTGVPFCSGDGSGLTTCPCGNAGSAGNGCRNSVNFAGANLTATGTPSLGADTVVLRGTGMPNSSALYLQGTSQQNGGAGVVFGDGLRCTGGAIIRFPLRVNSGGASQYPTGGDPHVSVRGLIGAPGTRTYQIWYRDAFTFCTPSTFNLSNGYQIFWSM